MGNSWQTPDQRDFFDAHLTAYARSCDEGDLKSFWSTVIDDWFKLWPLSEPSDEFIAEKGTAEKARKAWKAKKIEQIKRVFKSKRTENAVGSRRNLHLEDGAPRKRSELQMYMILYYDSRIRETVVKRWAEDRVPSLESRVEVNIPEDEIEPYESFSLRDPKIPISYKKTIAQELYVAESEVIKTEVRKQREAWYDDGKTIRTKDEDDRKALVREYQKNIPALSRNIGSVLRNSERKCAAKGIVWLACPSVSKGGKPVAYFQCAGSTPKGQDFETFIGKEKATEFKSLFSSWIHLIYPPSEWHLYSLDEPVPNDLPAGSDLRQDDEDDADADPQQLDLATGASTSTVSSEVNTTSSGLAIDRSAASPEINATDSSLPSGLPPSNPPASPSEVPTHVVPASQDESTLGLEAPSPSNLCEPSRGKDLLTTIDELPTNAMESVWMKSKKTLKYFREVHKVGKLSELILHWYQLEAALGFQETTPKGFPSKNRPQVLPVFFKNGHKYQRDYGLEPKSLGSEIMRWWEEIRTTSGETNICFGGPTGVYNLVVLMSWWCLLLKDRPDDELTNCFRTLEDIDRAILSAIRDANNQSPTGSSPSGSSLETPAIPPAHQPRGSKRAISDDETPRKRFRPTQA